MAQACRSARGHVPEDVRNVMVKALSQTPCLNGCILPASAVRVLNTLESAGLEAWVVGGAEVYRQLLPFCACAEVTKNHEVRPADTFFPDLDADPVWRVTAVDGPHTVLPGEGDEGLVYEFVTYRHQKPQDR